MRHHRPAVWIVCSLLLAARAAHGQPVDQATRSAASTLGYAGIEAFQAGDFTAASERLEKAYALLEAPSLGLWSARALVQLGRLVRARERYAAVTRVSVSSGDAAVQKQAQRDAARELAELGPRLAWVRVRIVGTRPSQVSLNIDAAPVANATPGAPIAVDPGAHVIEGRRFDRTVRTEVMLVEGQHSTVELRFPGTALDAAATRDTAGDGPWRAIGWTALALGGAGLAAGTAFGISSLMDLDALEDVAGCDLEHYRCAYEQRDRVQAYNTKRIVSGVGLVAGGALAAAGAYLLVFETGPSTESSPESADVQLRVAPDSVAVHGRF
jgi:hypothetical protein